MLYPTYDVDQRYRQGNIILCDIALWYSHGSYDIGTWPSGQTQTPHLYDIVLLYCGDVWNNALVRNHIQPLGFDRPHAVCDMVTTLMHYIPYSICTGVY